MLCVAKQITRHEYRIYKGTPNVYDFRFMHVGRILLTNTEKENQPFIAKRK